jgi:choline dehydrogenase-like flavoprotein
MPQDRLPEAGSCVALTDDQVIVIGSGPSGAVSADRLVHRGVQVLMLDAGLRAPKGLLVKAAGNTLVRKMGWAEYSTDRINPASGNEVTWPSSLSLGGLSNYWTAAVPRYAPDDFTDGARLDERYRWPISYDELVPFYEAAERLLTVTAGDPIPGLPSNVAAYTHHLSDDWQAIADRAANEGHGMGALPMAKGRPWMVARRGTEFSSYECVVAPLLQAPRFKLVTGAQVSRLNWSPSSGKVESVEYLDRRTGELVTARGASVVVAAGTVDTTTLLLRSTSSAFPEGLGNTSGLVGRYLHDHPRTWWPARPSRPLKALSHPVYVARAPHAETDPMMAVSLTFGLSAPAERLRTFYGGRSRMFGVQVFGTMVPSPDIGIKLEDGGGADPRSCRPLIRLRYDDDVLTNVVSARQRLQDVFSSAGVAVELPGPFNALLPGSSVHFAGTVRMHDDPAFGVLDRWNRIRDVPNVLVCDSSCFPSGPEKNPTLTSMAIAIRAADHLATELGFPPE